MKLADLTEAEQLAFGSLIRVMIQVDADYSETEAEALGQVADELGADEFWELMRKAAESDLSEESVKSKAQAVARKEVQELIYGHLFGIAVAGSLVPAESELLDWLETAWQLEIDKGQELE